jgi:hypothetical protein
VSRNDLFDGFNNIDDDILERSENTTALNVISIRRRLLVVLIAAILAIFLMGAGVVAIIYGDSIPNWFGHYWELVTGQPMSAAQIALIDHLSQDIGMSETVGDVTVTVDSATVGDDSFYILLRIEGLDLSNRHSYGFEATHMQVIPDPMQESGGITGYGIQFHGLDGDGAALILIDFDYALENGYTEDLRPLEVSLRLTNFAQNVTTGRRKLLVEGEWNFAFELERNKLEILQLLDTEVMAIDLTQKDEYTEVPVMLTDIELTNTGIRFLYDCKDGTLSFDPHIYAILTNGQLIGIGGGNGIVQDSGYLFSNYKWLVPVNLHEVVGIKIGGVIIPIE